MGGTANKEPKDYVCPVCSAAPNMACINADGTLRRKPHKQREELAKKESTK